MTTSLRESVDELRTAQLMPLLQNLRFHHRHLRRLPLITCVCTHGTLTALLLSFNPPLLRMSKVHRIPSHGQTHPLQRRSEISSDAITGPRYSTYRKSKSILMTKRHSERWRKRSTFAEVGLTTDQSIPSNSVYRGTDTTQQASDAKSTALSQSSATISCETM